MLKIKLTKEEVMSLIIDKGVLRPLAFMCYPDMIEYQKKEIDKATKDGSTIVLVNISEINNK